MLDILNIFTSQLMFTLIVPGILLGIALIVVGKFLPPTLVQYKIPSVLFGVALVVLFTFQSGRHNEYNTQSLRNAELVAQVAQLKAKSAEVTVETVTKYVDKIKYVDRWKEVPVNVYITKEADAMCVISPGTASNIRMLIDHSNEGVLPTTPISVNATAVSTN